MSEEREQAPVEPTAVKREDGSVLEEELALEQSSSEDIALRGAAVSGPFGGSVGPASGGLVGQSAPQGMTEEVAAADEEASH